MVGVKRSTEQPDTTAVAEPVGPRTQRAALARRTRRRLGRRSRWAIAVLAVLLTGAAVGGWQLSRATDTARIDPIVLPDDLELRSGDIVVAGGVSLQSRMVRSLTADNTYSHVGLIQVTEQGTYVLHAAPKGEGDGGMGDRVARLPLSTFLSERGYVALKVLRLADPTPQARALAQRACANAAAYADQAVPFDPAFDLSEQEAIYCSELVYLAYQQAGHDWPDALIDNVSTIIVTGPVILPDSFTTCPGFQTVWERQPKPKGTTP